MSEGKGGGVKQSCPQCGKPAAGNFCQNCGAALGGRFCNKCGAKLAAGASFCNQCGAKAPAGRGGGAPEPTRREAVAATVGGGNAPWWIAGVAMFGLILVVGWSMVRPQQQATPAGGMTGGAAAGSVDPNSPGTTDISRMSPREAADRLFDRVMRTISAGDTAGALGFQPMAVQAYEMVGDLDLDGMFHVTLLEQLTDPAAALATAKKMLEVEPDHILGLGMAAEAAAAMGEQATAREYYEHLLRVYDVEFARDLVEYDAHRNLMTQFKASAEAFLGR